MWMDEKDDGAFLSVIFPILCISQCYFSYIMHFSVLFFLHYAFLRVIFPILCISQCYFSYIMHFSVLFFLYYAFLSIIFPILCISQCYFSYINILCVFTEAPSTV